MSEGVVLVVEDEASFVEALTIGLRREGFEWRQLLGRDRLQRGVGGGRRPRYR